MKATCRLVVAAFLAVALSPAATLSRYPYLQNVRRDRAIVMWTTRDGGSTGVVQYSTDKSYSRSVSAQSSAFPSASYPIYPTSDRFCLQRPYLSIPYRQYQVELTGLIPDTKYFYRVMVDGQNMTPNDELYFRTAGPGPFTFLAFGDSGQATTAQYNVAQHMGLPYESPALVLHTGDIAYEYGTFDQFQARYFDYYANIMKTAPFFPAPGNHEYGEECPNDAAPFLAVHSVPTETVPLPDRGRYYSFDWGNVHFVALDANTPLILASQGRGQMLEWLESDLQKSRQFWRIVYWHQPPYAPGTNQGDPLEAMARQLIVPILERHDVQLVINGHEHSYQRTLPIRNGAATAPNNGTVYITTGGGGAGLYPFIGGSLVAYGESTYHYLRVEVQGQTLTVRAISFDGRLMDSITLAPSPVISSSSTVNAASFAPSVARGSLVSIFGSFLATDEAFASSLPLPQKMGDTQVMLNGRPVPLLYVSRTQINAQLPFDVTGGGTLRVTTDNGSSDALINVNDVSPGIFLTDPGRAVALHSNFTLVSPVSPAVPGETVLIYTTGLGAVSGAIEAGQPAPVSPLLRVVSPVKVNVGNVDVLPSFAGLAPNFAGLYQVNVQIPLQLPTGSHSLIIDVGGTKSNLANIPVR